MQDRLKFRGMTLGGEWVYGNLAIINKKIKSCGMTIDAGYYISNKVGMPFAYPVRPETIGQCTGLKDKNGKLIYEGDIIKQGNSIYKVIFSYDDVASCGCCVGKFSGCGFVMEDKYGSRGDLDIYSELEVIGNIHENPDLLENTDE
jgi:uncharacterized phage protein (TIGR01671 family)